MTRALKNLEHPGRVRNISVVPSIVSWVGDSSYKTHRKSKAEQHEKIRALQEEMNKKVVSLESQMDARVNEAVQLALSQQRAIAGLQPDVVIISRPPSDAAAVHPRRRLTYPRTTTGH